MKTLIQLNELNNLGELTVAFLLGASFIMMAFSLVILLLWLGFDKELRDVNK